MSLIFHDDFVDYINSLNKFKVEYILVGGMAVNFHGYRRSTGDMDIFVNPTSLNHRKLKQAHQSFGMPMGDMKNLEDFINTNKFDVFTFGISPVQIDIMTVCKGLEFSEAYNNAIEIELADHILCKVIDYRELILTKKASGRYRDLADIEELEKIKRSQKD